MDKIRTSKKQLKSLLSYDWWKFLIMAVLISIVSYYCFTLKHALKGYEQLTIFTSALVNDSSIMDEIKNETKDDGILNVSIIEAEEQDTYFEIKLETNGYGGSDVLILSESFLNNENSFEVVRHSLIFNDDFKKEISTFAPLVEYKDYEENEFALKIYDKESTEYFANNIFSSWLSMDETYYLIFVRDSLNLGIYGSQSSSEHDACIKMVKYLFERK